MSEPSPAASFSAAETDPWIQAERLGRRFRRRGLTAADAEDCVQETLLRTTRARGSADWPPRFVSRLAHSVWVDWFRRERRRRRVFSPLEEAAPVTVDAGSLQHVERLDLRAAVALLPEHLRLVVELSVQGGLSYPEIGGRLGIPVGTVKSRMYHALRRLRVLLGGAA